MGAHNEPKDLLPLTEPVFHILLSLADGERHGYAIMQEVRERTDGDVVLVPGTLYGAIKRMRGLGLIEETDARVDPELGEERRRSYRITAFGERVAAAEAARVSALARQAALKRLLPEWGLTT
ncbi:PadR family transcriptional regulator [Microbacterium thalassium]|uniref:DNA-binding PadR family transcriptional regulator n=1 Tax=Microbacterium thalassium TaxID=362649 RepID=A0A7X0FLQ0_9MICO|nr:PadR family transcriptional regulator [Microbacterium thalassium]MBB6389788.1 DNA-binding PadR family transcriptional regulator [Microbacterium thalassium]GLK24476.1 PadR family transcriptional regulator [Microbacterium thalassium]